jgi:transcriptional regulator with XRE-family HTH domain
MNYDNILLKVVFKLTLGERLKTARKFKGLTQDGLAEKIGTSRGVITNIEHDKTEAPQPLIINALCDVLEVNHEWLINGIGEMNNSEAIRSSKVLSEIYSIAKELSEEEQLYILDVIKTYRKHINPKESE